MPRLSAMIWLESRAGTAGTLSNINSISYPSNEWNVGNDTIQAKSLYKNVYGCYAGQISKPSFYDYTSATNSSQPQTLTKVSLDPSADKAIGLNNSVFDFRSNTLKNIFSPIEDVTARMASEDTTSEVIWSVLLVSDYDVVPSTYGQRVDYIIRGTISGTVNTTLTNFPITFDNSLSTLPNPLYKLLKADVCSSFGANKLIYSGIKFPDISHSVPIIPRSSVQTNISPLNSLPDGYIFDANNLPSLYLLAGNSATNDVFVDFFIQKM